MTPSLKHLDYRPTAEELSWTFGGVPPVRTITPPAVLSVWTQDAFAGRIRSADDTFSVIADSPLLNPQTGPFFIVGAQPGDSIAVHFLSIEPARDWGVSTTIPLFGSLTSTPLTATLQPPLPERVWIYDVDRHQRTVRFTAHSSDYAVDLPLEPMHGTVGVAPAAREVRTALVPGAFGGNMDTPEMRVGATCYLGVNVEGALLSVGDGHCRQGEGETCGVAVEAAMNSVIAVDLIKGAWTPWPRIETDHHIMSVGSTRPLEDAFRIAHHDMTTWIAGMCDLDLLDAYQLVTQLSRSPIANVCDVNYSVVCKVRKEFMPKGDIYQGVHRRLREIPLP